MQCGGYTDRSIGPAWMPDAVVGFREVALVSGALAVVGVYVCCTWSRSRGGFAGC